MKVITINGVELHVCLRAEVQNLNLDITFEWPNGLVTITRITKRELVKLLGLDEDKTDYAVPQDWADEFPDTYWRFVWYYGGKSPIFGEPVDVVSEVQNIAERILLEMLAVSPEAVSDG